MKYKFEMYNEVGGKVTISTFTELIIFIRDLTKELKADQAEYKLIISKK